MDSDAYRTRSLGFTALARDGPATAESPTPAPASAAIPSGSARADPPPETPQPEALAPRAQEGLIALIGALSLRAVRSRPSSR